MESGDTGLLLNKDDICIHREYFTEMVELLGICVLFRSPISGMKDYDLHGDLDAQYNPPVKVGCIFDEHPNIWTMKKMGWNSELSESLSIIHVPYDLVGLQSGSLFIIPSAIDNSKGRVFKVIRMSTKMIYPASIACEIGPVFTDTVEKSNIKDFKKNNFNMLKEEEDKQ